MTRGTLESCVDVLVYLSVTIPADSSLAVVAIRTDAVLIYVLWLHTFNFCILQTALIQVWNQRGTEVITTAHSCTVYIGPLYFLKYELSAYVAKKHSVC